MRSVRMLYDEGLETEKSSALIGSYHKEKE